MRAYIKINKCRICNSKKIIKVFDLKKQYIQGSFIKKHYPKPYQKKIPLKLVLCKNCGLLQTQHTTDKSKLYKNYWYMSQINSTMRNHLKEIALTLNKINNGKNLSVLDIGCNDGTLLNYFPKNIKKYGIDPSDLVKKIKSKKIKIIKDFFPLRKINIRKLNTKFDFITSIAMFYDIHRPNYFVKNIKKYLKKKGIWVFELSYLADMIKLRSFDTICHEHLEYYSLSTLNYLMKKNNLKIFKISRNKINGGSIRCYVTHQNNKTFDRQNENIKIKNTITNEKKQKLLSVSTYQEFYQKSITIKNKINKLFDTIKKNKKKVYILGASTKGNTILQFLNIEKNFIKLAVERNKEKTGAYIIGSNIKIISENSVKKNYPDYYLVLPWHFKKEIINREKVYIKNGGSLIFPLPRVHIINKENYKKYVK